MKIISKMFCESRLELLPFPVANEIPSTANKKNPENPKAENNENQETQPEAIKEDDLTAADNPDEAIDNSDEAIIRMMLVQGKNENYARFALDVIKLLENNQVDPNALANAELRYGRRGRSVWEDQFVFYTVCNVLVLIVAEVFGFGDFFLDGRF